MIVCPSCGWTSVGRLEACLNCRTPLRTAQPAWRPTHEVPRGGMQAWTTPDAAAQPVAVLGAHTELQLVEVLGAWGRVSASNGWTGWVDARELVAK